jgi:hypothetical protein
VLIDTRDLFVLDQMASSGRTSADEAKRRLMNAKLRFELREDGQAGEGDR